MVADTASRQIKTRTTWTLDKTILQSIRQRFDRPLCIPFKPPRTQVCLEVPRSGALAVDAFLLDWSKWTCPIHPAIVLLLWILRKIKEDQATAVLLIAPNWTGQSWFPDLIKMLVDRACWCYPSANLCCFSHLSQQYTIPGGSPVI